MRCLLGEKLDRPCLGGETDPINGVDPSPLRQTRFHSSDLSLAPTRSVTVLLFIVIRQSLNLFLFSFLFFLSPRYLLGSSFIVGREYVYASPRLKRTENAFSSSAETKTNEKPVQKKMEDEHVTFKAQSSVKVISGLEKKWNLTVHIIAPALSNSIYRNTQVPKGFLLFPSPPSPPPSDLSLVPGLPGLVCPKLLIMIVCCGSGSDTVHYYNR